MTASSRTSRLEAEAFLAEIAEYPEFEGLPRPTVNAKGNFGNTPLKIAAVQGNVAAVDALVAAGADVNARNEDDYTALHHAVTQGHLVAAKRLLALGADPHLRDRFGKLPVDYAKGTEFEVLLAMRRE